MLGAGEYVTLVLGNHGGVLGETCAITILIGGCYLIATKVISPMIPLSYLATVAVLSLVAPPGRYGPQWRGWQSCSPGRRRAA